MIETWLHYQYGAHLIDWLLLGAALSYAGAIWYQSRKWR